MVIDYSASNEAETGQPMHTSPISESDAPSTPTQDPYCRVVPSAAPAPVRLHQMTARAARRRVVEVVSEFLRNLAAALVDRLLLYRAPVEFGEGIRAFPQAGPNGVPSVWNLAERRQLGSDTLEVYTRAESQGA